MPPPWLLGYSRTGHSIQNFLQHSFNMCWMTNAGSFGRLVAGLLGELCWMKFENNSNILDDPALQFSCSEVLLGYWKQGLSEAFVQHSKHSSLGQCISYGKFHVRNKRSKDVLSKCIAAYEKCGICDVRAFKEVLGSTPKSSEKFSFCCRASCSFVTGQNFPEI